MHSTHLRKKHIHGALLGSAVGEAIGIRRSGLSRRAALRSLGRLPMQDPADVRVGRYGENTRLMLLNAQAILNSRNEQSIFRHAFRWRMSWYLLSLPYGSSCPTLRACVRCWFRRLKIQSGVSSTGNQAAARAIMSAPVMNGAGHRISRWIEESTRLTHNHRTTIDGCRVLGMLSDYACTHTADFDPAAALQQAIEHCGQAELSDRLKQLAPLLEARRSPHCVAVHFGWTRRIERHIVPTTIMGSYCFLRHPRDFQRAVASAVMLGGDTAGLGAVVGGLCGAHLGDSGIPTEMVQRLGGDPHDPNWIAGLAERFAHWPHGADDLYGAPAQSSDPIMQLARNLFQYPPGIARWIARIPARFFA